MHTGRTKWEICAAFTALITYRLQHYTVYHTLQQVLWDVFVVKAFCDRRAGTYVFHEHSANIPGDHHVKILHCSLKSILITIP